MEKDILWKTADELNEPERIMACIDIYQALTEDRPYKKGLSHEKHVIYLMTWHRKVLSIQLSQTNSENFQHNLRYYIKLRYNY